MTSHLGRPAAIACLALCFLWSAATVSMAQAQDTNPPGTTLIAPSLDHGPEDVVALVVAALKRNDPDDGDQGIATVFGLASPANRSQTGPLPRFVRMLKSGYGDMLNHRSSRLGELQIDGDTAIQPVWLVTGGGREVGYLFRLGRQSSGEYTGMWMTDAVYPLDVPDPRQSI